MAYVSCLLEVGLPVLLVSRPGEVVLGRTAGGCNSVLLELQVLSVLSLRWIDSGLRACVFTHDFFRLPW